MRYIFTIFVSALCNFCIAQTIGSKVSFYATDGKTYTGIIKDVQGDKYKIKYDGFDFESWLISSQFTLSDTQQNQTTPPNQTMGTNQPDLPVQNENQQTIVPNAANTNLNTDQTNVPTTTNIPAQTNGGQVTSSSMTSLDSLKMALSGMKTSSNKLFGVKRDTMTLTISDIDYDNANLAQLKESLKKAKGVKSVIMHFKSGTAIIEIAYKGKASEVWDNLPAEAKTSFSVLEFNDNNIILKHK